MKRPIRNVIVYIVQIEDVTCVSTLIQLLKCVSFFFTVKIRVR